MARHQEVKRRKEEKKRRRRTLEQKRQRAWQRRREAEQQDNAMLGLVQAVKALKLPQPASWPGGCDLSLSRPDLIKAEFGQFTSTRSPGQELMRRFEDDVRNGPLGFLPDIDHWAMEEFLWHGAPGSDWHPLEAFLIHSRDRFPPAAQKQLRLWKQAQLGTFLIGLVKDDVLTLEPYDLLRKDVTGETFRAIALNIGGVNLYRDSPGKVTLTYVAPWLPQENLSCAMGYGLALSEFDTAAIQPFLGLRNPDFATRRWPWNTSLKLRREYRTSWRDRDWNAWLTQRMKCPFTALIPLGPGGSIEVHVVNGIIPSTPAESKQSGVYFDVELDGEATACGATAIKPTDLTSLSFAALAEYAAFREYVGPPQPPPRMPDHRDRW